MAEEWGRCQTRRRHKEKRGREEGNEIEFFQADFLLGLFLSLFSFSHESAHLARIITIEGLHDSLFKAALLRVGDEHVNPGEGLKNGPVDANRKGQEKADRDLMAASPHSSKIPERTLDCQSGRR